MPPRKRSRDPYRKAVLGVRRTPRRHPFADDGIDDGLGRHRCRDCGLPLRDPDPVHQLPPTPPGVREAEARRVGEHE